MYNLFAIPGAGERNLSKGYIDANKVRIQREARDKIRDLLDYGSEEDFIQALKSWKKDMLPEELAEFVNLYRAARIEKRGLSRRRD